MPPRAATYLDSNAGAPLRREVVEALLPLLKAGAADFQVPNPSSIHSHGRKAKKLMAEAREQVALSLGSIGSKTDPEQIIFTSSGTEANQLAIRSILEPRLLKGQKPHWITTAIEHDSNLQMVAWLESRGGSVSVLPVDARGALRLEALPGLFKPETALVSAVWVNNETGVISDIEALANAIRARGAVLHLDAAQAWGKIAIALPAGMPALVSFSGHKIGALAGTGALWVGRGTPVEATVLGKQEKGRRGGTHNLLGIVAIGAAASALVGERAPEKWAGRVAPLRNRLEDVISTRIAGTQINGATAPRVANTSNLSFDGVEGDGLVMALDLAGYSVSAGSACASGTLEPSHVLLAMGKTKLQAMAGIRVSLADALDWEELAGFVDALAGTVERVRKGFNR